MFSRFLGKELQPLRPKDVSDSSQPEGLTDGTLGVASTSAPMLSSAPPTRKPSKEPTNHLFIKQEQEAFAAIEEKWEAYKTLLSPEDLKVKTGFVEDLRRAMEVQKAAVEAMVPAVTKENAHQLGLVQKGRKALEESLAAFDARVSERTQLTLAVSAEADRCDKLFAILASEKARFTALDIPPPKDMLRIENEIQSKKNRSKVLQETLETTYLHRDDIVQGPYKALQTAINELGQKLSDAKKTWDQNRVLKATPEAVEQENVTQDATENPSRLKGLQERVKKLNPARLFKKEKVDKASLSGALEEQSLDDQSPPSDENQEETATPSDVESDTENLQGSERKVPSLTAFVAQPTPSGVPRLSTQSSSSSPQGGLATTLTSLQNALSNFRRRPTSPNRDAYLGEDESESLANRSPTVPDEAPTSSDTEHVANNAWDSKQKKRFHSSFLFFSKKSGDQDSSLDSARSLEQGNALDVSHILDNFNVLEWENKNPGMFSKTAAAAFKDLLNATNAAIKAANKPHSSKAEQPNKALSASQSEATRKKIAAEAVRVRNLEMHREIELEPVPNNPNEFILKKRIVSGDDTENSAAPIPIVHIEKHVKQKGAKGAAPTEAGLSIRAAMKEPAEDTCELMLDKMRDAKRKDRDKAVLISGCDHDLVLALQFYMGCIVRGLDPQLSPTIQKALELKADSSDEIKLLAPIYSALQDAKDKYKLAVIELKQAKSKEKRAMRTVTKDNTHELVNRALGEKNRIKNVLLEQKTELAAIKNERDKPLASHRSLSLS
jgi:hypothetical protein